MEIAKTHERRFRGDFGHLQRQRLSSSALFQMNEDQSCIKGKLTVNSTEVNGSPEENMYKSPFERALLAG
jgi:hypothetical protein